MSSNSFHYSPPAQHTYSGPVNTRLDDMYRDKIRSLVIGQNHQCLFCDQKFPTYTLHLHDRNTDKDHTSAIGFVSERCATVLRGFPELSGGQVRNIANSKYTKEEYQLAEATGNEFVRKIYFPTTFQDEKHKPKSEILLRGSDQQKSQFDKQVSQLFQKFFVEKAYYKPQSQEQLDVTFTKDKIENFQPNTLNRINHMVPTSTIEKLSGNKSDDKLDQMMNTMTLKTSPRASQQQQQQQQQKPVQSQQPIQNVNRPQQQPVPQQPNQTSPPLQKQPSPPMPQQPFYQQPTSPPFQQPMPPQQAFYQQPPYGVPPPQPYPQHYYPQQPPYYPPQQKQPQPFMGYPPVVPQQPYMGYPQHPISPMQQQHPQQPYPYYPQQQQQQQQQQQASKPQQSYSTTAPTANPNPPASMNPFSDEYYYGSTATVPPVNTKTNTTATTTTTAPSKTNPTPSTINVVPQSKPIPPIATTTAPPPPAPPAPPVGQPKTSPRAPTTMTSTVPKTSPRGPSTTVPTTTTQKPPVVPTSTASFSSQIQQQQQHLKPTPTDSTTVNRDKRTGSVNTATTTVQPTTTATNTQTRARSASGGINFNQASPRGVNTAGTTTNDAQFSLEKITKDEADAHSFEKERERATKLDDLQAQARSKDDEDEVVWSIKPTLKPMAMKKI